LENLALKPLLIALAMSVAALSLSVAPTDADAKRLGGGRPAGMQRQAPAAPAAAPQKPATPAQNAAPAQAPATPAAPPVTPPKRNWMGPLAGLAAGLGLAALFSHFGMGAGMSNIIMMAMLAFVAFIALRWVMGRFAGGSNRGPQLAGAGGAPANWQPTPQPEPIPQPMQRAALEPVAAAAAAPAEVAPAAALTLPGGVNHDDFVRLAKMVFIRLQAANDAANIDDLRKFTTPELFASLRVDLQERGAAKQQTDVVQIDAQVVDVAQENGQDIVSVRFHGLIREVADASAEPFNELWHLVRPASGAGDWAIAGITPVQ
jgi:predicted lipid-binding transport protein (Tim44 family)